MLCVVLKDSVTLCHSLTSDCINTTLQIEPQLLAGKNVMIAAHGNSLRSIIMYLDKLTSQEVSDHFDHLDLHDIFGTNHFIEQNIRIIYFFCSFLAGY